MKKSLVKLVILDRDGVINEESDSFVKRPEEWVPIPGSLEAIARLTHAGYLTVVATNQSGIARGLFDIEMLNLIHQKMHQLTQEAGGKIDAVFFCPDVDMSNPERKPNPGMLQQIAKRLNVSLTGIPVIGDSLRDVQAAQAVNASPKLVRTGKGEETVQRGIGMEGVPIFDDLAAVISTLLTKDH